MPLLAHGQARLPPNTRATYADSPLLRPLLTSGPCAVPRRAAPRRGSPLKRLPKAERARYDVGVAHAAASGNTLDQLLDPAHAGKWDGHRSRVLALHRQFAAEGGATPTEVAKKALAAIKELQPVYKMFAAAPDEQGILEEARRATQRYAAGRPLSVFDGVPVAFKDMIPVKGYVMTAGSAAHAGRAPSQEDDLLVARFRALGAVVLPPTSMTEGGVTPIGYGVHPNGPYNPFNPTHYSGGSSGGSAVAVALGICPVAIGFDGGGSVRTPAALSGVFGLATGFGRVPFSSHFQSTMIKSGPLASTAADAALAYAVIARHSGTATVYDDMYDGSNLGMPLAHLNAWVGTQPADLKGVRLGVFRDWCAS